MEKYAGQYKKKLQADTTGTEAEAKKMQEAFEIPVIPQSAQELIEASISIGSDGPFAAVLEAYPRNSTIFEMVTDISSRIDSYLSEDGAPSRIAEILIHAVSIDDISRLPEEQQIAIRTVYNHLRAEFSVQLAELYAAIQETQYSEAETDDATIARLDEELQAGNIGYDIRSMVTPSGIVRTTVVNSVRESVSTAHGLLHSVLNGKVGEQTTHSLFGVLDAVAQQLPDAQPLRCDSAATGHIRLPEQISRTAFAALQEQLKNRETYVEAARIPDLISLRTDTLLHVLDEYAIQLDAELEHLQAQQKKQDTDDMTSEQHIHNLRTVLSAVEDIIHWVEERNTTFAMRTAETDTRSGMIVLQQELHMLHGARSANGEQQQRDIAALNGLHILKEADPSLYLRILGIMPSYDTGQTAESDLSRNVLSIAVQRTLQLMENQSDNPDFAPLQEFTDGLTRIDQRHLPILSDADIRRMQHDVGQQYGELFAAQPDAVTGTILGVNAAYQMLSLNNRRRTNEVLAAINEMELLRWEQQLETIRTGHPEDVLALIKVAYGTRGYTGDSLEPRGIAGTDAFIDQPEFRAAIRKRLQLEDMAQAAYAISETDNATAADIRIMNGFKIRKSEESYSVEDYEDMLLDQFLFLLSEQPAKDMFDADRKGNGNPETIDRARLIIRSRLWETAPADPKIARDIAFWQHIEDISTEAAITRERAISIFNKDIASVEVVEILFNQVEGIAQQYLRILDAHPELTLDDLTHYAQLYVDGDLRDERKFIDIGSLQKQVAKSFGRQRLTREALFGQIAEAVTIDDVERYASRLFYFCNVNGPLRSRRDLFWRDKVKGQVIPYATSVEKNGVMIYERHRFVRDEETGKQTYETDFDATQLIAFRVNGDRGLEAVIHRINREAAEEHITDKKARLREIYEMLTPWEKKEFRKEYQRYIDARKIMRSAMEESINATPEDVKQADLAQLAQQDMTNTLRMVMGQEVPQQENTVNTTDAIMYQARREMLEQVEEELRGVEGVLNQSEDSNNKI